MSNTAIDLSKHRLSAHDWVVRNYITETPAGGRMDGSSDVLKELAGDGQYRTSSQRQLVQRGEREGYLRGDLRKAIDDIAHVSGAKFVPHEGPLVELNGSYFHNTWQRPSVEFSGRYLEHEPKVFGDFLNRWFIKAEEREFFVKWMAATICKPTWQVSMAVLLRSAQGTGKGCLWDTVIAPLCGEGNAKTMTLKQAMSEYAGFVYDSSALYVNEVYNDKKAAADKLKKLVTDRTAVKNGKFKDQAMTDVNLNVFIDSNAKFPLHIEKGDRRYWVPEFVEHKVDQKETAKWLNSEFVPWVSKAGGLQEIRDHLEWIATRISEGDFERAPNTAAKLEITAEDSSEDYEVELRDFLMDRRAFFKFTPAVLQSEKFPRLNTTIIRHVMKELGFQIKKRGSGNGRKSFYEHSDLRNKRGANPLPWSRENERHFVREDNQTNRVSTDGWPMWVAEIWKAIGQGRACATVDDGYLRSFIKQNKLWGHVVSIKDFPDASELTLIKVYQLRGKVIICDGEDLKHAEYLVNLANQLPLD
jgi:hypothetical protein